MGDNTYSVMIMGDIECENWKEGISLNEDKEYDVLLAPHHCSWHAISTEDTSTGSIDALIEEYLQKSKEKAYIIASSKKIKRNADNPPSFRAMNFYKNCVKNDNRFICTADELYNDGFENVRITDQRDILLVDYKAMTNYIKVSKDNQGFEIFNIKRDGLYRELTTQKFDYLQHTDKNIPCIFAFDRIMPETDYIVNQFNTFSDVEIFNSATQVKKGIRRYRAQSLRYIKNAKRLPKAIMVVLAIKRPMQVLGTFDKFDYIAFLLNFDFESNPAEFGNSAIYNYATVGLVNKELAEKISGTEFEKPDISMVGVGAIGSKVSMHLAKMGYVNQKIYDDDCLLPHNLIRHEEKSPIMIGLPKVYVAQQNIKALFREDTKVSMRKIDILAEDVQLVDEIIIDATASERCLNFL